MSLLGETALVFGCLNFYGATKEIAENFCKTYKFVQFKSRYIEFYPFNLWQVTSLPLVLSLVVQQLQGIKYPLLFKWMNESMNEWRRTRVTRHLKVGSRPCVCVSMLCELVTRSSWRKRWSDKNPVGQTDSRLELVSTAFQGAAGRGGKGWNHTQAPPLLFSNSPACRLRRSTCKKIKIK